jgi:hypothetical protein
MRAKISSVRSKMTRRDSGGKLKKPYIHYISLQSGKPQLDAL